MAKPKKIYLDSYMSEDSLKLIFNAVRDKFIFNNDISFEFIINISKYTKPSELQTLLNVAQSTALPENIVYFNNTRTRLRANLLNFECYSSKIGVYLTQQPYIKYVLDLNHNFQLPELKELVEVFPHYDNIRFDLYIAGIMPYTHEIQQIWYNTYVKDYYSNTLPYLRQYEYKDY